MEIKCSDISFLIPVVVEVDGHIVDGTAVSHDMTVIGVLNSAVIIIQTPHMLH